MRKLYKNPNTVDSARYAALPIREYFTKLELETLLDEFEAEMHERAAEIDPDNDLSWYELGLGWCIAKVSDIDAAVALAVFIRYQTDMG